MLGKKEKKGVELAPLNRVLEIDASMQGALTFNDPVNLRINGNFEGSLDIKGILTVGEEAVVRANIRGETLVLTGEIIGDVFMSRSLEIGPKGRLIGDVTAPSLSMQTGAILQGQVNMLSIDQHQDRLQDADHDLLTVDELAEYLSLEKTLIYEWARQGKLPGVQEGNEWLFKKEKVDEWIAAGRMK